MVYSFFISFVKSILPFLSLFNSEDVYKRQVPEFVTEAAVPGAPVVVEPTVTVAGVPLAPFCPAGIVKFKTALQSVPELVTEATVPGAPVVVLPTVTLGFVQQSLL